MLCDKRMPVVLKGQVYHTRVRPGMIYSFGVLGVKEDSDSKVAGRRDEDDQMDMWVYEIG